MVLFIIVPELLASFTSKIYETDEDDSLEIKVSKNKRNNQVTSHKYKTKNWLLLRDQVFEKYERKCANCGATDNIDVHHKISLKEGGANCIENLIPLCRDCHEKLHGYKFSDDNTKIEFNESYGYKISKDKKSLIGYKICNAIKNKYKLKIKYKSGKFHDEKITERIIRPIEIKLGCECSNSYVNNSDYDRYKKFLRAFCELRQAERLFRLDRIIDVLEIHK
jgi:hypothetical protein